MIMRYEMHKSYDTLKTLQPPTICCSNCLIVSALEY